MVKNILQFLHREISSLHQAAYLLGLFALLSQVLALFRDRLLAYTFGASQSLDIYYAAFRIPDFIFIVVGSIVSISVLIPFLAERIDTDFADAKKFIDYIFTFFFVVVIVVSGIAFFALPWLLGVVFSGFHPEAYDSLVTLSRILLLSPILLGISNLFGSITQIHRRFFIYAISPVLYNVGIIGGIVFLTPVWGIYGVAVGVVLGAVLHGLVQVPYVVRAGLFPLFRLRIDWSLMYKISALSLPRTITLGSTHAMILVLLGVASHMDEGSIAIFNFSYNLQNVPLAIIGVSYSLAAFPTLSHLFVGKQHKKFMNYIITATRHIIFWTIPIAVLFIVLRAQIVRTILGSGQFDWDATRLTAAALALFCVSILFQSLSLLFVRGYYSAGMTAKPLFVSVGSSILGIILAFALVWVYESIPFVRYFTESLLRVEGIEGTKILMLVLAFTIAQSINALLLMWLFQRDFSGFYNALARVFFHSLSAGMIAGAVTWAFLQVFDDLFPLDTIWGIFLQGFVSGVLGIIVGVLVLVVLDNRELKEITRTLHQKLWKTTNIVGPDPEV